MTTNDRNVKNTLINPYELLGIDIKNKKLKMKDIKKAYFEMAMICHPDKGGSNNDMNIVQQAYEFVKEQMTHHSNMTDDKIEKLEQQFFDFYKKQEEVVPPFADIYNDVREWRQKFNEEFEKVRLNGEEKNKIYSYTSPHDGYGNLMQKSTYKEKETDMMEEYNKLKEEYENNMNVQVPPNGFVIEVDDEFFKRGNAEQNYKSEINGPICLFGKQIIQRNLEEISSFNNYYNGIIGYTNTGELAISNYSILNNMGVSMTDYKEAHKEPCLIDLTQIKEKTTPLDKLMKNRMNDRDEMDKINNNLLNNEHGIDLSSNAISKRNERMNQRVLDNFLKDEDNRYKISPKPRSYVLPNLPADLDIKIEDRDTTENTNQTVMREVNSLDVSNDFVIIDNNDIIKGVKSIRTQN